MTGTRIDALAPTTGGEVFATLQGFGHFVRAMRPCGAIMAYAPCGDPGRWLVAIDLPNPCPPAEHALLSLEAALKEVATCRAQRNAQAGASYIAEVRRLPGHVVVQF